MKTRIISFLSAAALLAGCYEDAGELGVDTATRIALSPAEIGFTADGTTVDGKVAYVGVVQVMPFEKGRYTWRAEGDVAWATVGETVVDESFADTWTGAVTTTRMRAVEIMATPNTEYRRSGVLTVTAEDGTVETFPITQAGLKADAEIVCELAETGIEYASAGGETTIDYTTNMGDVYDYSVTYGEPDAGEWLTWSDEGAGRVVLRAAEWTSKSDNRTAVFTIHVGTADTSEASAEIAVVQLRVDDYYYLYGASVPRYEAVDAALQMTKQEEGVYTAETYFAADGTNPVRINKDSRTASYPCYVLAAGGTVAEIASAEAPLPAGPEIDADGLRTLTVDFNRMTWQWERITTPNCLPDDRVADYPTKAYVTPRGTYKTWMTRNLDWDGGDGIGVYKLGCPLVFSATNKDTGGYNSKTDPTYSYRNTAVRNPAWDDTGNGGELEPDAAITALGGRHYTFYEYLTGAPRGGLMEEYYSEWPAPYTVGREVRDAADYTILFEGLTSAKLQEYAGREEEFFEEHPVSRIQIQGICPYGWHVANFQDWYDILYAAYDFGSKNNGGYVPKEPSFANTVYGSSSAAYKINVVPYLRISRALWTVGGKCLWDEAGSLYPVNEGSTTKSPAQADIADNSEEFGFNLAPTGWRAMSVGWQDLGLKTHVWIPMPTTATYTGNGHTCYMGWRLVAMTNNGNWIFRDNYQNGNVAHGVRCVKNYDAE
uniref:BACON domain-containing protein n=1 Tax=Alistipes communis TaxID=2585118 RepID=UPI003FD889C5